MTFDEILFVLLIAFVGAGDGLLLWIAKHLHERAETADAAPSAEHAEALTQRVADLTEAVEAHVAVSKVTNATTPGVVARIEAALIRHNPPLVPAAPAAAPDPHPAGMVAAPAIPVVMPSAVQPVAPADLAAMLAHMQAVAEHMRMLAVSAGEQNPASTPSGFSAVTLGAGGAAGGPEPTAQPMTAADPAPTVQPTVAAAGVAA